MPDDAHYAEDIAKYTKDVDRKAVAGIVRHCGIALHNRDSALVSANDEAELARVRDNFLKKTLGLSGDAALDAAVKSVTDRMKGDHHKSRVTVYYLLAEHFGKLDAFGGAPQT